MTRIIIYTVPMLKMKLYMKLGKMIYSAMKNRLLHYSYEFFKRKRKLTVTDHSTYSKQEKFQEKLQRLSKM